LLSLVQARQEQGGMARHFGANVNIEELGSGRYRVRSLMIFMSLDSPPGSKGFMNVGDHDDIVAFDTDGTCRFIKRTMQPVSQFVLSPLVNS